MNKLSSKQLLNAALSSKIRLTEKNSRQILCLIYQYGFPSLQTEKYIQKNIARMFWPNLFTLIRQKFNQSLKLSQKQLAQFKFQETLEYLIDEQCIDKIDAIEIIKKQILGKKITQNLQKYVLLEQERQQLSQNIQRMIKNIKTTIFPLQSIFQQFQKTWRVKTSKIKIIKSTNQNMNCLSKKQNRIQPCNLFKQNNHSNIKQQEKQSDEQIDIRAAHTFVPPRMNSNRLQNFNKSIWSQIQAIDLKIQYYFKKAIVITGLPNSGKTIASLFMPHNKLQGINKKQFSLVGVDIKNKKQFKIKLKNNESVHIYQCTQFQSNSLGFQKNLLSNYQKYRTFLSIKQIKFLVTVKEEQDIQDYRKQLLKTIIMFLKNFNKREVILFESISILITHSTLPIQDNMKRIKQLSELQSYQKYGVNESQKLTIDRLIQIALQKNRIFVFPKITMSQGRVKLNLQNKSCFQDIYDRSNYWNNDNPEEIIRFKTLSDIAKQVPNVIETVKLFIATTNQRLTNNLQLVNIFSNIVEDIKQFRNSSKSKFLSAICCTKNDLYSLDRNIVCMRKEQIKKPQLVNKRCDENSLKPFWIRALQILQLFEETTLKVLSQPIYLIKKLLKSSEDNVMKLMKSISSLCQSQQQYMQYTRTVYLFYRFFREVNIFYQITRGERRIQAQFSFHVVIGQRIAVILTQQIFETKMYVLSKFEIEQSLSLQNCLNIMNLYNQFLVQINEKEQSQKQNKKKQQFSNCKLNYAEKKRRLQNLIAEKRNNQQ